MNISTVVKGWERDGDWYVSPGVNWCEKGNFLRLGSDVTIGDGVRISNGVTIGDGASIGPGVRISNGVTIGYGVIIGDRVTIGDAARIGDGATIGDGGTINSGARIGREAFVRDNCDRAVSLGYDSRDYALVVARQNGEPRFGAGCRWFTLDEAREHWGPGYKGDGDPEYFQIMIDAAERISALWEN